MALRFARGRIEHVRLLTGVGPIPWRAREAEHVLIGAAPNPDLFRRVAHTALASATPFASNGYKVPPATALLRRALTAVT